MFRWAEHVDADHVQRVRDALDALPAAIPEIRRYVHGSDVGVSEGSFDYVVVADFDSVADWRVYREHPTHLLMIEELITGHVAERAAVQYQTGTHDTHAAPAFHLPAAGPVAGEDDWDDDELMERARRAASERMHALLAEPDDT
jgi:hypothetical protein